ncbi:MAG: collagen-like protein, partial [Thermoleophilia bacterium]|nr:collagen-like protein [Thermoleophilia bacterium]
MIALVVAAAGGGYAAAKLPKNSVGTAQLRNGSVTSAKVRNHSLLAVDFKPGQLERVLPTAIGPTGPTGPSGADGATGAVGATGDQGDSGPTGPVGDSGAQGPIGTQGAAGLSYGNSIVGAPTSSLTGCGTLGLANTVIAPTQTSRIWISGQARLSANGATGARLIADVRTGGGSTLGSPDSGAPFPITATLPV